MPNKKHPDRDRFMAKWEKLGEVPSDYAVVIRHTRPDLTKRYIHDVRHARRTDLEVIGLIERVVQERTVANMLHPQPA